MSRSSSGRPIPRPTGPELARGRHSSYSDNYPIDVKFGVIVDVDGEISGKHENTLIRTLRKVYGQSFAAGYPETEKLREVLLKLNETSLSQLRSDHETGHLEHKIVNASK